MIWWFLWLGFPNSHFDWLVLVFYWFYSQSSCTWLHPWLYLWSLVCNCWSMSDFVCDFINLELGKYLLGRLRYDHIYLWFWKYKHVNSWCFLFRFLGMTYFSMIYIVAHAAAADLTSVAYWLCCVYRSPNICRGILYVFNIILKTNHFTFFFSDLIGVYMETCVNQVYMWS